MTKEKKDLIKFRLGLGVCGVTVAAGIIGIHYINKMDADFNAQLHEIRYSGSLLTGHKRLSHMPEQISLDVPAPGRAVTAKPSLHELNH